MKPIWKTSSVGTIMVQFEYSLSQRSDVQILIKSSYSEKTFYKKKKSDDLCPTTIALHYRLVYFELTSLWSCIILSSTWRKACYFAILRVRMSTDYYSLKMYFRSSLLKFVFTKFIKYFRKKTLLIWIY